MKTYALTVDEHLVNPIMTPLREEWRAVTKIIEPAFPGDVEYIGNQSWSMPESEREARHYKEWREPLAGEVDGRIWPKVAITLEHRLVSDWQTDA